MTKETQAFVEKFNKIANSAFRKAQDENRRLGIPNVYSVNGIMVYEYDGKVSMDPPKWWKKFNPATATNQ